MMGWIPNMRNSYRKWTRNSRLAYELLKKHLIIELDRTVCFYKQQPLNGELWDKQYYSFEGN